MHMADALVSPVVGGTLWGLSASAIAYSSSRLKAEADERRVPLMGVLGAFLFVAQMINFSIPGTGASGHLGGGLLLAILLGPHAALLVITSVLIIQAFFFADGGLLALGCNIFNMGVIPAFLVYPLLYRPLSGNSSNTVRRTAAIMFAAVVTLQLGPFCVVLETLLSNISALPFSSFLLMMQPVHLAIGLVEGVITATIVSFVFKARPEIFQSAATPALADAYPLRTLVLSFLVAAFIAGGSLSLLASQNPDGLEWAIQKVAGSAGLSEQATATHRLLMALQNKLALLPDYAFRQSSGTGAEKLGTSLAGVVGGTLTLLLLVCGGFLLKRGKNAMQDK